MPGNTAEAHGRPVHRASRIAPFAAPAAVFAWFLAGTAPDRAVEVRAVVLLVGLWLPASLVVVGIRRAGLRWIAALAYLALAGYALWFVETSESSTAGLALLAGFLYGLPAAGLIALLDRAWRGSR